MRWQDYLDILIVAALTYLLLLRIKGTKAFQIILGVLLLLGFYFLTKWASLYVTSWIFQYLWAVILLALIVLFQPEIRRVLEEASPLKIITGWSQGTKPEMIQEVVGGAFDLASRKIGAIMVFPRRDNVDEFIQDGVAVDGVISRPLILNIFHPPSPLHDGAVIFQGGRIVKAGCFLPLTESHSIPQNLGSRHRAALGLTERTDAVCLVVSEERSEVSLCYRGKIRACPDSKYGEEQFGRLLQTPRRKRRRSVDWRRLVLGNLWSKVFSIAFAVFLWGTISGARTSEISLRSTIEYAGIPEKMALKSEWTGEVSLRVRGSKGLLAGISSENLRARLNLGNTRAGTNFINITPDDLNLPPGVQITSIKPSVIKIVLERIEKRAYPVEVQMKDSPPPGVSLVGVTVDPKEVRLEGPLSQLDKIEKVLTEPVSLSEISSDTRISRSIAIVPSTVLLSQKELPKVTVTLRVVKTE
jgi:uncharacterized protein (TIGR00159 family)